MGFTPRHKVILLFGAIRPYKGLDTALKALGRISSKCPELRILIAGKLWENWEPYRELIQKLGIERHIFTCLEYIPAGEVYRFFTAADLVVCPYRHFDSQSGVASTAVAFRKPLIVTDVGGLPDLVADGRFVVPPDDAAALAKAITECVKHYSRPETPLTELDRIAEKISPTLIADKSIAVYRKVLRRFGNVLEV